MSTLNTCCVGLSVAIVLLVACGDDDVTTCPDSFVLVGDECVAPPVDAGADVPVRDSGGEADSAPLDASLDVADPGLEVSADRYLLVPKDGSAELHVELNRLGGFDGEVRVEVNDLPGSVGVESVVIAAGESSADLTLTALATALEGGPRDVTINARAVVGSVEASTSFGLVIRGSSTSLDQSFGVFGQMSFLPRSDEGAYASMHVLCDSLGRLYVFGEVQGDLNWSGYLARLTSDGDFDESFGEEGVLDEWGLPEGSVSHVLLDGERILVGASLRDEDSATQYLRALTLEGEVDSSFGVGGDVVMPGGVWRLLQGADEYLVVSDALRPRTITAVSSNGELSEFTTSDTTPVFPSAVAVDDSGRLVLGGVSRTAGALPELGRLTAAGNVDLAFGTSGRAQVPFLVGEYAGVNSIASDPDGVGYAITSFGGDGIGEKTVALFRFNEDGSTDSEWGSLGWALITEDSEFGTVIRRQDGRLLVAYYGVGRRLFTQFTADGRLDTSFGTDGTLSIVATGLRFAYDAVGERLVLVQPTSADRRFAEVRRIWL